MADATNGGSASEARERPIGELVKDLSAQTSTLARKEIEEYPLVAVLLAGAVGYLLAMVLHGRLCVRLPVNSVPTVVQPFRRGFGAENKAVLSRSGLPAPRGPLGRDRNGVSSTDGVGRIVPSGETACASLGRVCGHRREHG